MAHASMGNSKCLPCWIRQQKDLRSLYLQVTKLILGASRMAHNGSDDLCLFLESAAQRLSPTLLLSGRQAAGGGAAKR
jgi:hypothetical protein